MIIFERQHENAGGVGRVPPPQTSYRGGGIKTKTLKVLTGGEIKV
jgi:hypothetical protein